MKFIAGAIIAAAATAIQLDEIAEEHAINFAQTEAEDFLS